MIVFSGALAEQSIVDRMNRVNKIYTILVIVGFVIITVGIVLCAIYEAYVSFYVLVPCETLMVVIFIMMRLVPIDKRLTYADFLLNDIQITISNEVISYKVLRLNLSKPICNVKKVIDTGELYYLIFKFGDITNSWICQKDLLIQGSIEEFEKLFEDKIVRE